MSDQERIRVLHVFGKMDRGGAETWIMNVFRFIDRDRFQFDFAVSDSSPGEFDEEIRRLGGNVHPLGSTRNLAGFLASLREIIRDHGPYDAIHSHVHDFSGPVLSMARLSHVPIRISHSHTDTRAIDRNAGIRRRYYLRGARFLIRHNATRKLGCSVPAAESLFGSVWKDDPRASIHYCGIDLRPFSVGAQQHRREAFGYTEDSFVLGHVARFIPLKNHKFLVEIARILHDRGVKVHVLTVGDGPLRGDVEQAVREAGLSDWFSFLGVRSDVVAIMRDVLDVFLLPSLQEGLPLVGLEAQAAGLPCLVSDVVTRELARASDLVEFLPIDSAEVWANRLLELMRTRGRLRADSHLESFRSSPFNIHVGVEELERLYAGA